MSPRIWQAMKLHWKILIIAAVLLLVLVGISLATMRMAPQKAVDAYRKSLIASGEKLEISEVSPPPVPPEQNGAYLVKEAAGLFTSKAYQDQTDLPPAMLMIMSGKAVVGFEQPDVHGPHFTNSWANVLTVAEENRPATELLRQAMNFPALDFSLDYSQGVTLRVEPLSFLRDCGLRLSAEAICNLHNGDAASATTNLCAMLAMVNGMQDERLWVSQVVRISIASTAADTSWALLQSTNVNDDELAVLQKQWEPLEFIKAMKNALLMERAFYESTIKKMRGSIENFNAIEGLQDNWNLTGDLKEEWNEVRGNLERDYGRAMVRGSWTYSDELRMLQTYQMTLQAIRVAETNGYFNPAYSNLMVRLEAIEKSQGSGDLNELRWTFSDNIKNLAVWTLASAMVAEVGKRMVIAAIALKRYQLKHGKYPSDLNALAPEFLLAVPLDPVDGKPLRYRLNADGTFILYSIGSNGVDDGGNASLPFRSFNYTWPDRRALDWVWPQPATPAEIQYYYAHPPR
jgi:hypothetical protein